MSTDIVRFNIRHEKSIYQVIMEIPANFTEFIEKIVSLFLKFTSNILISIFTIEIILILKM